ncbi:HigA family addiction module antitoxin [Taklimakanibacter deserti]|uniref:HigA family addiction module antitoxin n=1 Tax=Taklimakanibacter deserti TaxID=2267839 RepID=UPI000E64B382
MAKKVPPMHPGEVLREEFMKPLGLTAYALAKALGVPRTRIERIEREETAITADTAHRLGRYFGTTPQFWLNLQTEYDLRRTAAEMGSALERIEPREAVDTANDNDRSESRRKRA